MLDKAGVLLFKGGGLDRQDFNVGINESCVNT